MPGRRNFQRERSAHRVSGPARQAAVYDLLHTQLPHAEVALIGQQSIQTYLQRLGIRRRDGRPLKWRIIERWRTHHGCPILRGYKDRRVTSGPFTSSHALMAWLLSRFTSADLFKVDVSALEVTPAGSFHAMPEAQHESATQ